VISLIALRAASLAANPSSSITRCTFSTTGQWVREVVGPTSWAQKRTERPFESSPRVDLPELAV
jgi:hypothetical protein